MRTEFKFQTNISDFSNKHILDSYTTELKQTIESRDYSNAAASLLLPTEKKFLEQAREAFKKHFSSNLKYIFLIGIGGSNLGTQAIYYTMRGKLDFVSKTLPKIIFLDALNAKSIELIHNLVVSENITDSEYLIISISKSGSTIETAVNTNLMLQLLGDGSENNLIYITDSSSKLWKVCKEKRIDVYEIPEKVGGRYSVFSNVGLLPLYFVFEEKLTDLLKGASDAISDSFNKEQSPAMHSALELFNNKPIVNEFFFDVNLEYLGKWYRQLVGESLGKKSDYKSITPIVSIGSTDLHSMLQLYLGGNNDKFTHFITTNEPDNFRVVDNELTSALVSDIEDKNIADINTAIIEAVKKSYIDDNREFNEIILDEISLYNLGYYLQTKMIEVMFLAKLMNINAFDQPNVEDYKILTKEKLKS
ncbi:hypothetical protein KC669_04340 [Candidatus Dojkabacteria bacterium]|uniref:Glucose-6-phosphate isomerase n=1 Tax=Candidatus Dojkabacteria bacterium TaxID=2099670 RepID=A0A955RLM5_9BACT|nr:hypothetical protein [Candidatus Dojkabacteria bacterium]